MNQPFTRPPLAFVDARVVDPSQNLDDQRTVLVEDGKIKAIEAHVAPSLLEAEYEIIDCRDKVLIPGLIDFQVRTGEPGSEHEETLVSASQAAVAGGVTTIITQPDTNPVIDDIALVDFITRSAGANAVCNVKVMGALTKGLAGKEMSELRLMREAGAVAFTNCKRPLTDARIMRRALSYARDFDGLVIHHCDEPSLSEGGVMNEGEMATRLGLPGIPKIAEVIMLERDLRLVEITGGRYHAASLSCAESVDLIRQAKKRGLNVTAGASVNNATLNENDIGSYRTFFKLSPPLRLEEDRMAVVEGIKDGTIDVVHSDHTPRDVDMKRHPFADASNGAVGLESLLAALLRLVHNDDLDLSDLIRVTANNPANLVAQQSGTIKKGANADLALLDIDMPWILDEAGLKSFSKNTAFEGARFTGRCIQTFVDGMEVYRLG
ncbi:MAG: dihydroorotase [Hyphomicrobiales bacterium]